MLINTACGFEYLSVKASNYNVVHRRVAYDSGEINLPIGEFYGYAVLTDAEIATTLKGTTRIIITDM